MGLPSQLLYSYSVLSLQHITKLTTDQAFLKTSGIRHNDNVDTVGSTWEELHMEARANINQHATYQHSDGLPR